ncbi:unnamed protein product [Medioppia subpectinata]|uniref:Nose resistant-to-fluoxetine protein N-terminal domain-containing protein n=1 Tax=Medioppia subpectinata TaxID=1979941 RepID=A0A7R9KH26_9ACAR|nr:unnamed protein product [Medioppia subpectinata]CAG2102495.1 unnamed protein product [Medioppia subpectinata]
MIIRLNYFFITLLVVFSINKTTYGNGSDDYDYSLGNESNSSLSDDGLDDTTDDSDHCSDDVLLNKFIDIFIPDDYEEGKANIKRSMGTMNETMAAIRRLQTLGQNISEKMSEFNKRMTNRMSEMLMTINLEPTCMASIMRIMTGVRNGEVWAMKFFDAQPRLQSGMVDMTGFPFGNYDQCMGIEGPDEDDKPKIRGQYCGIDVRDNLIVMSLPREYVDNLKQNLPKTDTFNYKNFFNQFFANYRRVFYRMTADDMISGLEFIDNQLFQNMKILNGFCLPTTCRPRDVSLALNQIMYPITRIPITLSDDCEYADKPIKLNSYEQISIIGILSLVVLFVVSNIIMCCSSDSYTRRVIKGTFIEFIARYYWVKTSAASIFNMKQHGKFKALDGYRACLTIWVVILHTYEFGNIMMNNKNYFLGSSYKMIHDYRNMIFPNILLMDNFMIITEPCYDKWYKPLTMTNNILYYPNENTTILSSVQCMTITWYSSMDFQLYAMAPIAFILLYRYGRRGVYMVIGLLLVAIGLPVFYKFVMGHIHVYEIISHTNAREIMLGWKTHYWGPINYVQTFIIGMLLSCAVRYRPDIYLGGTIGHLILWFGTACITLGHMYWQRRMIMPGFQYAEGEQLLYLIIHKPVYLAWFAWLIYATSTGRGDPFFIKQMHVFVFVYRIGMQREHRTYNEYYIWSSSMADFVFSYILGVITGFLVSRPFAAMTTALLRPPQRVPKAVVNEEGLDAKNTHNNDITTYGNGSDDYGYSVDNQSNSSLSDDGLDDTADDSDHCSDDVLLNKFIDIFIPDDYEEGKANIKRSMGTMKETMAAIRRLQTFGQNISEKMSEFNKRMTNRMSEMLMTVDLEPTCMASLVRIMTGIQNGEVWAIK